MQPYIPIDHLPACMSTGWIQVTFAEHTSIRADKSAVVAPSSGIFDVTRGRGSEIESRVWTVVDELSFNVQKPGSCDAVEPGRRI